MEFTVDLLDLQKAFKFISTVAKQNDEDAEGHILLNARSSGELVLLSSSGNLSITHTVPNCQVVTEGILAVSFKKLSSFIVAFTYLKEGVGSSVVKFKGLKNDLSLSIDSFTLNGKKSTHKLKLRQEVAQKVAIPSPFNVTTFEINAATLRLAISKVIYAVNPSSIRDFLQGVNINFDKDFIYFVGTDAQKLSEYKTPNTSKLQEGTFTVNYSFINALKRVIDDESLVSFSIDSHKIKARINNTVLHGTILIGDTYPDYRKALQDFKHSLVINKDEFLGSLAPLLPTLDKEDHNRLTIKIEDNKLSLNNDYADAEYGGEISFDGIFIMDLNGIYLLSTLTAIMDDLICFKFSTETSPLIFDSFRFSNQKALITPVRRH